MIPIQGGWFHADGVKWDLAPEGPNNKKACFRDKFNSKKTLKDEGKTNLHGTILHK